MRVSPHAQHTLAGFGVFVPLVVLKPLPPGLADLLLPGETSVSSFLVGSPRRPQKSQRPESSPAFSASSATPTSASQRALPCRRALGSRAPCRLAPPAPQQVTRRALRPQGALRPGASRKAPRRRRATSHLQPACARHPDPGLSPSGELLREDGRRCPPLKEGWQKAMRQGPAPAHRPK